MRPKFDYYTDHFPYDAESFSSGTGLLKTVVLGVALVGVVLIVAACFGPEPAPVVSAAVSL